VAIDAGGSPLPAPWIMPTVGTSWLLLREATRTRRGGPGHQLLIVLDQVLVSEAAAIIGILRLTKIEKDDTVFITFCKPFSESRAPQ
jgi:hypothetical protein